MGRKRATEPTPAELAILRILWDGGPSTVRQVREQLPHGHRIGYTTVLKQLQILKEKGFVSCDDRARSHVYRASVTEAGNPAARSQGPDQEVVS